MCRNDSGARRHDDVGSVAQPVAPATHRLDDEYAVDDALRRTRVIDDRRIHLEHRDSADLSRSENALTAEIVVPLDHNVRPEFARVRSHAGRAKKPQAAEAKRRTQREPLRVSPGDGTSLARRYQNAHLVPKLRESFCDGRHVHRAAVCGGHRLVDGRVENSQCRLTSSAKNGPDRSRPKRVTSSMITRVMARNTR